MIHDEQFWKECYRDALRELVRAEGFDAIARAPQVRRVCQTIANESDEALFEARQAAPKCTTCKGLQWVFDTDPGTGDPIQPGRRCPECNTKTDAPPAAPPVQLSAAPAAHGA